MTPTIPRQGRSPAAGCPSWCVADHADDSTLVVHRGRPVALCEGVEGHVRLAVDRRTGAVEGPAVVIGTTEYSPGEVGVLAHLLLDLAAEAAGPGSARAAGAAAQASWARGERLLVAARDL